MNLTLPRNFIEGGRWILMWNSHISMPIIKDSLYKVTLNVYWRTYGFKWLMCRYVPGEHHFSLGIILGFSEDPGTSLYAKSCGRTSMFLEAGHIVSESVLWFSSNVGNHCYKLFTRIVTMYNLC